MNADRLGNPMESFEGELTDYKKEEEKRLVGYLSERYGIPLLQTSNVDPSALQLVDEKEAREAKMAVYKKLKGVLSLAIHEPSNPKLATIRTKLEKSGYSTKTELATTVQLEGIWSFYQDIIATSATVPGRIAITNDDLERIVSAATTLDDAKLLLDKLKTLPPSRRISKNIEYLLFPAVALGVSDIHLESTNNGAEVRYRLDGVLVTVAEVDTADFKKLLTRLKLTSQMKITSRGAQDGGFVVTFPDRTISVRASVIPDEKGGSFVIRLLDPKNVVHGLEKLGLHEQVLKLFKENAAKPNGLILTTGPTGSGKTTTLYSFLGMIAEKKLKIITLEDPIEYRLEGIVQTQIKKSYSFSSGLRSILRQDPDVIMVGEIRDKEVAEIAVQAALTGHLVFSTLHTNDAVGAIHRLVQLGMDAKLLSRAINIVIAQRLARVLCPHCAEKHPLTEEQKKEIERRMEVLPESYRTDISIENILRPGPSAKICKSCVGGYKGRVGIFEVFEMNDKVEQTYRDGGSVSDIMNTIRKQGMAFLEDDCLWKVLKGETSLEEMERVLGIRI